MKIIVLLSLMVTLGLTIALAHNGVEHVMGTVTAVDRTSITVENLKHESVTVLLAPTTKVANGAAEGTIGDVKVGQRVVIDAKPGVDKKLVAVTVKLGSAAKMEHHDH